MMTDPVIIGDATLYYGDALECLTALPDESVHCCVTSPPYWGLRDYGVSGAIGLEPTFQEWLDKMVAVCREVRRVLRKDGTFWLNCGDCYAANRGYQVPDNKHVDVGNSSPMKVPDGFKPKDLLLMPARLAIALQTDGWWVRSEIIWAKPNPMPESVADRPTSAHEKIYLLTKSAKYFYDADAVREKSDTPFHSIGGFREGNIDNNFKPNEYFNPDRATTTRNLRNVWTIATQPYGEAHFATFPEALPMKCIMAGTSERGCCPECGKPWERIVEIGKPEEAMIWKRARESAINDGRKPFESNMSASGTSIIGHSGNFKADGSPISPVRNTVGFQPACDCGGEPIPCTVLDPFSGAATTGLVALKLERRYIGIELNPDYIALSIKRIEMEARQEKLF